MSCESLINLLAKIRPMLFLILSLLLTDSMTMSCSPGKDYRLGITSIDQTNSTTKGTATVNETVSFICSSNCGSIFYYIYYIDDKLESHHKRHYAKKFNDEVYFQGINAHLYFETNYTTDVDCSSASTAADGISAKLRLTPNGVGLYHVYCLNWAPYDDQRHYNVYSEISQVMVKRGDSDPDPVTSAHSSQERTSSKMLIIPSSSENTRPTNEPNCHSTCYDASDMMMTAVTTQTSTITTTETVILTSYTAAASAHTTSETTTLTTFALRTVAETSRSLQTPHLSSSSPDIAPQRLRQSDTGSSENIAKANTVLISVCIASAALVIMLSVVISTISLVAARCTVKKMQRNDLTLATTAVNPSVVSEP